MLHVTKVTLELRFLRDIVARKVRKGYLTGIRLVLGGDISSRKIEVPESPVVNLTESCAN